MTLPFRPVEAVVAAQRVAMGGMTLLQPLPRPGLDQIDPFLLIHHHGPVAFPGGGREEDAGVPPHPHRGFDPVTFIYRGGVHHRDSLGNDSVVGAGGVQWTTTGRGLIHSERPPKALVEEGGEQELIQVWVNVPSRLRMTEPRYQPLRAQDTPTVASADGLVTVHVVAGPFEDVEGPIETLSPVTALNVVARAGGARVLPLPEGQNALLYLLDGRVVVNGEREVAGRHLVRLGLTGGVHVRALEDTRVLVLAGEPLNEPFVASGPFVVDTRLDVYRAMQDYQEGRMGTLAESF